MNNWEYYHTSGSPCWFINNKKTDMFFQTEYESYAKWLVEVLNLNDEINEFRLAIDASQRLTVTDDGDLFKIT